MEAAIRAVLGAAQGALDGAAFRPLRRLDAHGLGELAKAHLLPLEGFTKQIYLVRLKTLSLGRAAAAFWSYFRKEASA